MPSDLFSPVDDLSGAGISENCEMAALSKGMLFTFEDANLTATAATIAYTLYKTGSKRVRLQATRQALGGGIVTIKFYKNPTITTLGTEISSTNRNDCSSNVPEMKIYKSDTVVATTGTNIKSTDYIFVTATGEASKTTSSAGDMVPWQFDANSTYLTKVTFSGNTAYSLKGCFVELDNEKEAP